MTTSRSVSLHGVVGLLLQPLLLRQQVGLHGGRIPGDRRGRVGHLRHQRVDRLRVLDQPQQALPVVLQQFGDLLQLGSDGRIVLGDRAQRVLDEFQTRHRRIGDGAVGIDHEGVHQRDRRLILGGNLLGAEFDGRQFFLGRDGGEIVELVAQAGAAAGDLVLSAALSFLTARISANSLVKAHSPAERGLLARYAGAPPATGRSPASGWPRRPAPPWRRRPCR